MIRRLETLVRRLRRLFSRTEWMVRLFGLRLSDDIFDDGTRHITGREDWRAGLVMVQIDGLGKLELQKAMQHGEMPFLSRLIANEHYHMHSLYSGLPSSTPSVQGELFYGIKTVVPAFAFYDKTHNRLHRMYDPASAAEIEAQLNCAGEALLTGGSAYCNIYTGGADEAHFCAASSGWGDILKDVRPLAWIGVAVLYLPMLLRAIALGFLEVLIALIDMVRGLLRGRDFKAELKFVVARVGISILLRDLITIGAQADITRGLPVIHLNYLGYDEQAHRRGPDSAFAHRSLKGIDQCIEQLWTACHQARYRHYDLWIYSDHGQEATIPYQHLAGQQIKESVRQALAIDHPESASRLQSLTQHITERRARLLDGYWLQKLIPASDADAPTNSGAGLLMHDHRPVVVAMGPVGHVYLDEASRDSESVARLAAQLVDEGQVPAVLYIAADDRVRGYVRGQAICLPEDGAVVLGAAHPFLTEVLADLIALVRHCHAGDLVLLGWVAGAEPVSFPLENGSHAGAGPHETGAFALLPADVMVRKKAGLALRPLELRRLALDALGRGRNTKDHELVSDRRQLRQAGHLRIMSYNVHSCIGMDSRIAPERIARVIARYQPDVVALQELDLKKLRTNGIDQAELIAGLLEMEYHFHPAIQVEGEEYGDAILTHLPICRRRAAVLPVTPLSRPGNEPRGAIWVTLDVDGIAVQVVNTHLGLFSAERRAQVLELTSERWLAHPDCQGPTIFCGDLNATPRSPTLLSLKNTLSDVQSLVSGKQLNTFTGRLPGICIDHVLVRDISRVTAVDVPNTELTRIASDHLPVIVDLVVA